MFYAMLIADSFNNDAIVLPVKHKEHELAYFVCVREKNGGCKIPAGNTVNKQMNK